MKKIILGIVATLLVAGTVVFASNSSKKSDSCCGKNSACCYPGSPCCQK